jgi:hypothetical protein
MKPKRGKKMSEEIRTVLSKIERETLQIIRGMAPNSGSSVFVITPSIARELLTKVWPRQRPLRRARVSEITRMIRNGQFEMTHQGLLFDAEGWLHDGQHRLSACVMSGVSIRVQCSVTSNPRVYKVLDQGAKRTVADLYDVTSGESAVCRFIVSMVWHLNQVLAPVEYEWIWDSEIYDLTQELLAFAPKKQKGLSSGVIRACAVMTALIEGDADYAFSFYKNLNNLNFEDLPPVGRALIKRYSVGKLVTNQSYNNKVLTVGMFMHVFNSKNSDRKNPSPRFDKIDGLFKDTRVEMVSYVLRKGLVDEDWSGFSRVVKPPADIELKAAENV